MRKKQYKTYNQIYVAMGWDEQAAKNICKKAVEGAAPKL